MEVFSNVLSATQMSLEVQWRAEDLAHRKIEEDRRRIDDRRRAVGEKAEQLKVSYPHLLLNIDRSCALQAIGSISALVAGFAMVVLTNVYFPKDLESVLLCCVGFVTATVVSLFSHLPIFAQSYCV